jgi:hypothetical protein
MVSFLGIFPLREGGCPYNVRAASTGVEVRASNGQFRKMFRS